MEAFCKSEVKYFVNFNSFYRGLGLFLVKMHLEDVKFVTKSQLRSALKSPYQILGMHHQKFCRLPITRSLYIGFRVFLFFKY